MNCSDLAAIILGKVFLPGSTGYAAGKTSYFASFENEMSPACFVQPSDATEVADIIKHVQSIHFTNNTDLAVRSGGHTCWAGLANTNNGITIDLSNLNAITLNPTTNIVPVGVGNAWGNVYETRGAQGLAIIGGRVSDVGVGGLTLGGGLSFYSAARRFVCDDAIGYEVVLASGDIVQANAAPTTSGLQIDFPTFQQGQMWGGTVIYNQSAYPALIQFLHDFVFDPNPDENTAVIVSSSWVTGLGEFGTSNLYHTTPITSPPSLKPFADIRPQLQSNLRNDSLLGFTVEQSAFATNGARQWFFTTSFRVDLELMSGIETEPGLTVALVFTPITQGIIAKSASGGTNSLRLSTSDGPFIICLLDAVFASPSFDDIVSTAMLQLIKDIDVLAAERRLSSRYKFSNYGYKGQNVIEGCGEESIATLVAASKKYDPTGFFQTRIPGGFKVSETGEQNCEDVDSPEYCTYCSLRLHSF